MLEYLPTGDRDDPRSDAVREKLVRLLRVHRPRLVITFDPNGTNLHPDHVKTRLPLAVDAIL